MTAKDVLFGDPGAPFVSTAREILESNRKIVRSGFPVHLARHEELLDDLYAFASSHTWTFRVTRSVPTALNRLAFSATHKNIFALLGILENVQAGLVGATRPLFRQIIEGQLLAKFAIVTNDAKLAERWLAQEPLSVPRVVFAELYKPQADVLRTMWSPTHVFVHASTGSQQVSLDAEDNMELVAHDLTVMGMLLHTQHHLTTQHTFSRAERYYAERYGDDRRIRALRRRMRANLSLDLKEHGKDVRAFIRTFRSKWRSKNGAPFPKS